MSIHNSRMLDTTRCAIGGTVWDEGDPLAPPLPSRPITPPVEVELRRVKRWFDDEEIVVRQKTDEQGRFRFVNLVPGNYTLTVKTKPGMLSKSITVQIPPTPYDLEVFTY